MINFDQPEKHRAAPHNRGRGGAPPASLTCEASPSNPKNSTVNHQKPG
jgi:hypothetical protein